MEGKNTFVTGALRGTTCSWGSEGSLGDCLKEEASEPRLGNMEWGHGGREGVGNHTEVEMHSLRNWLASLGRWEAGIGEVMRIRMRGLGHESRKTSIEVLVIQVKVDVSNPLPPSP